jgi:2-oxoacid dehydrogenases acyltransferase (catalytic domain)
MVDGISGTDLYRVTFDLTPEPSPPMVETTQVPVEPTGLELAASADLFRTVVSGPGSLTPQGPFGLPHVLKDADVRSVSDLTEELHRVKGDPSASPSGSWLERAAPAVLRIPGAARMMYAVMARSVAVRQSIGTVAVTSVGMFLGGGGFGLAPMTLMTLEVVVGGMTQRPRVVNGHIGVRDVLDLAVALDHNVVDGAPATRFVAELRELIESAAAL